MRIPALLLLKPQAVGERKGSSPSCLDENPSPDGASAGHGSEQPLPGQRNFHCYYQIFIKSNWDWLWAQAVCAERGRLPGAVAGTTRGDCPPSGARAQNEQIRSADTETSESGQRELEERGFGGGTTPAPCTAGHRCHSWCGSHSSLCPPNPTVGLCPPLSMLGSCQSAHLRWSCISGCEG